MNPMSLPDETPASPSVGLLVDRVCNCFEDAWAAGRRPRIEEHLADTTEPGRSALLRELVVLDANYRRRVGEDVRPTDYRDRFPEIDHDWLARVLLPRAGAAPGAAAFPDTPRTECTGPTAVGVGGPAIPGYEVLGELGRGGMGVVYQARQTKLHRVVALKVILAGQHAGPEELARFRREAEAVAHLQHPHIVQIHEVGEQDGRPFFALEFVDGGSLAQKLAGTPQPAREAAQLVESLARAMHYAHQRGIIHRDLKPANVLLTAEGVPKITDFGLAKRLQGEPGASATGAQTQSGALLGTPSYMAPEQAAGQTKQVGPATDVYALGAILYELLTGRPPFRAATVLDTLEQVRSHEPVPPRQLQPQVPRDLETICLKALAKVPAGRYATAEDLAEDLRRWLNGEPIQARPVGNTERLWRWCRRNPVVASLSAAMLLLLTGGLALVTALWLHAAQKAEDERQARELADQRTREAKEARQQTWQAFDDLTSQVALDWLATQPELLPEQRRFLESAVKYYRQLAAEQAEDEPGRKRVAHSQYRLAYLLSHLGLKPEAEAAYRRALVLNEALATDYPAVPVYRLHLAWSRHSLGVLLRGQGKQVEAEAEYRAALRLLQELARQHPAVPEVRRELARSHHSLGGLFDRQRKWAEAEPEHRAALRLRQELVGQLPAVPTCRSELAESHTGLGILLDRQGKRAEAEAELRAALRLQQELVGQHPTVPGYRQELATSRHNLGVVFRGQGKRAEAEAEHRAALKLRQELAAQYPAVPAYRQQLAASRHQLGLLLGQRGEPAEAEAEHREARRLRQELAGQYPAVPDYRQELATSRHSLGVLLNRQGKWAEAEAEYREALKLWQELAGQYPGVPAYRRELATSRNNLGGLFRGQQKRVEAETEYREALRLRQELAGQDPAAPAYRRDLARTRNDLGGLLHELGKRAEAEAEHRAALKLRQELAEQYPGVPDYLSDLGGTLNNLARLLRERGELDEARRLLQQAIVHQRAAFATAPRHPTYGLYLRNHFLGLSEVLLRQRDHAGAAQAAEEVAQVRRENGEDPYLAAGLLARCVPLAEKSNDLPEAQRQELAQSYADQATNQLRQAVQRGFRDVKRLKEDEALAPLRSRPDFQKVLAELEKK